MPPFVLNVALGLIGTGSALGSGVGIIPAILCGTLSGGISAWNEQCPRVDSMVVGEGAVTVRAGDIIMAANDQWPEEYALEMLGDNFCMAHQAAVTGTSLGAAIGQNALCVQACEILPAVAVMSGYETCRECCKQATISGYSTTLALLPDLL